MQISIDTSAVENRLAAMHDKIEHFKRVDLGQELSEWQVEDLHRNRPFTMRWRTGKAQTVLRPHSLYEMLRSEGAALPKKQQMRLVRGIRSKLGHPLSRKFYKSLREHRHWSTRPILRAEMEAGLWNRMRTLFEEKITWA